MKRAIIICITVLAVLLVYPSTNLLARSPASCSTPSIITTPWVDQSGPPPLIDSDGEDDDSGDVDDLAGLRDGKNISGTGSIGLDFERARFVVKVWWMFFFHRLF